MNSSKRIGKYFFIFVVVVLVILGVIALLQLTRKGVDQNPSDNSGKQQEAIETKPNAVILQVKTPTSGATTYLMSAVTSDNDIKDYSFLDNKAVYATSKGFFEAGTKKLLLARSISFVDFNTTGQAVYQSGNEWFVFNAANNKNTKVSIAGSSPRIHKNGNFVASFTNEKLQIRDVNSNSEKTIDTGLSIKDLGWAYETSTIAVFGSTTNGAEVKLYNEKGDPQKTISAPNDTTFLGVSPGGDKIAFSKDSTLTIRSSNNEMPDTVFTFEKENKIAGSWVTTRDFIITQTPPDDSLGRKIDYIWETNAEGGVTFLSDSFPMFKRLDTTKKIKTNPAQNVLFLVENSGPLWLLSLLPKQYPFYSESGVFIQTLDQRIFNTSGD